MPQIQVLSPHIADLIAAGEVVERPASVAKELLENAIDAGASAVTVEIAHGGMTFLRVTDNGCGIAADQLKTAFLRHATSKLRTEYDLEAIGTLGFRGEALAAISAVSRLEVLTRTSEAELGAALSLEGGIPGSLEQAGCPVGTTMVVRDLFFNTPARLKFLKKDSAEGSAVSSVVQRIALSHPEVSVKFIRDGKQELFTPGDGTLKSAVYAVLGRELALGFQDVHSSGDGISVTGFVSLPVCCRGSRNFQFFFVNGRQIKSRLLMAALEEAYQNQKMVGKFPACVLHVEMKHSTVDVNVHPAKLEVKFSNERAVFSAVYHGVLSALTLDNTHPPMTLSPPSSPTPPKQESPPPAPSNSPKPLPRTGVLSLHDVTYRSPARAISRPSSPISSPSVPSSKPTPPQVSTKKRNAVDSTPPSMEGSILPGVAETPNWRIAGEILHTYLIVEQGDQVYLIDKHAAHERMNFDRMKAQDYEPMSQTLLTPVVCHLSAEEREVLFRQQTLLERYGFEVEELAGNLVVRQAPFDVELGLIEETLCELAQRLLQGANTDPSSARDELLHTMACKASVKGGWHTSPKELERIAQAVMTGTVKYCPHGRPVAITLTKKALEKQFKRA